MRVAKGNVAKVRVAKGRKAKGSRAKRTRAKGKGAKGRAKRGQGKGKGGAAQPLQNQAVTTPNGADEQQPVVEDEKQGRGVLTLRHRFGGDFA